MENQCGVCVAGRVLQRIYGSAALIPPVKKKILGQVVKNTFRPSSNCTRVPQTFTQILSVLLCNPQTVVPSGLARCLTDPREVGEVRGGMWGRVFKKKMWVWRTFGPSGLQTFRPPDSVPGFRTTTASSEHCEKALVTRLLAVERSGPKMSSTGTK